MQASVEHQALAPILEAGGGGHEREPRRSLRHARPPPVTDQPRRYTMHLQALAAAAAPAAAAAAAERSRPPRPRISSLKSWGGDSQQGGKAARQPGPLENTYRTEPVRPFQLEAVQALLEERLAAMLHGYRYDAHSAPTLSRNLALEIKNKVKQACSADQHRYKLITLVTIAEPSAPAGLVTARALWSAETGDACANADFRSSHVAASAAVFAFYCE